MAEAMRQTVASLLQGIERYVHWWRLVHILGLATLLFVTILSVLLQYCQIFEGTMVGFEGDKPPKARLQPPTSTYLYVVTVSMFPLNFKHDQNRTVAYFKPFLISSFFCSYI